MSGEGPRRDDETRDDDRREATPRAAAEGVENESAWRALCGQGCDAVQGYHVGRPLPVDEFPAWASTSRWNASVAARTVLR
jgi:predicted signal transduction protein with EAL and GGDEF domain